MGDFARGFDDDIHRICCVKFRGGRIVHKHVRGPKPIGMNSDIFDSSIFRLKDNFRLYY